MTEEEMMKVYQIPIDILKQYESCWRADGQYDERDVKNISLMMSLQECGFNDAETLDYLKLYLKENKQKECMNRLESMRKEILSEVHIKESQLNKIDCLRYSLKKSELI